MHWLVSIELTLSIKPFQYLEAKLTLHRSVRFRLPLLIPPKIQSQDTERKKHLIVDSNSLHSLLCWFLFDVKQYQRAFFFFLQRECAIVPEKEPFPSCLWGKIQQCVPIMGFKTAKVESNLAGRGNLYLSKSHKHKAMTRVPIGRNRCAWAWAAGNV